MKIQLDLEISSGVYNDEQMEKLRMAIRRELTGFIFHVTDHVQTPSGALMKHSDIVIEGSIKAVY